MSLIFLRVRDISFCLCYVAEGFFKLYANGRKTCRPVQGHPAPTPVVRHYTSISQPICIICKLYYVPASYILYLSDFCRFLLCTCGSTNDPFILVRQSSSVDPSLILHGHEREQPLLVSLINYNNSSQRGLVAEYFPVEMKEVYFWYFWCILLSIHQLTQWKWLPSPLVFLHSVWRRKMAVDLNTTTEKSVVSLAKLYNV
jgi:hypothetical protein